MREALHVWDGRSARVTGLGATWVRSIFEAQRRFRRRDWSTHVGECLTPSASFAHASCNAGLFHAWYGCVRAEVRRVGRRMLGSLQRLANERAALLKRVFDNETTSHRMGRGARRHCWLLKPLLLRAIGINRRPCRIFILPATQSQAGMVCSCCHSGLLVQPTFMPCVALGLVGLERIN